jgi:tetratricopeptide (TPR) repeat protein
MPFERFPVEKPAVLKASTPGGHPVIRAVWLGAVVLFALGGLLFVLHSFSYVIPLVVGAGWLIAGLVAYAFRHARFLGTLARGERAIRSGDLPAARALVAPLVDRFPTMPAVQRLAGLVLYASGDPLSAAAMLEGAARVGPDSDVVVTLAASYAALNKAGDARRAASLRPDDPDVRLVLVWAELVALGGDRARGAMLATALPADTPARAAMAVTLQAIAAAERHDARTVRARLGDAEDRYVLLAPDERAFLGYLGGVALRELGAVDDARATFSLAMEAAPDTIGEALARRERAHMPSGSGSPSSDQPSSD